MYTIYILYIYNRYSEYFVIIFSDYIYVIYICNIPIYEVHLIVHLDNLINNY